MSVPTRENLTVPHCGTRTRKGMRLQACVPLCGMWSATKLAGVRPSLSRRVPGEVNRRCCGIASVPAVCSTMWDHFKFCVVVLRNSSGWRYMISVLSKLFTIGPTMRVEGYFVFHIAGRPLI